jgi:hypothetical protein
MTLGQLAAWAVVAAAVTLIGTECLAIAKEILEAKERGGRDDD